MAGQVVRNGFHIGGSDQTFDDFTIVAGANVTGVGFYFQNSNGITGWDQKIDYRLYSSVGGEPGALLASGNGANVTAVDSGQPWCCAVEMLG